MSLQICPKCGRESFTWTVDEEISDKTIWGCGCGYIAYEKEEEERICTNCKNKTESKLKDSEKEYWWCCICNSREIIN